RLGLGGRRLGGVERRLLDLGHGDDADRRAVQPRDRLPVAQRHPPLRADAHLQAAAQDPRRAQHPLRPAGRDHHRPGRPAGDGIRPHRSVRRRARLGGPGVGVHRRHPRPFRSAVRDPARHRDSARRIRLRRLRRRLRHLSHAQPLVRQRRLDQRAVLHRRPALQRAHPGLAAEPLLPHRDALELRQRRPAGGLVHRQRLAAAAEPVAGTELRHQRVPAIQRRGGPAVAQPALQLDLSSRRRRIPGVQRELDRSRPAGPHPAGAPGDPQVHLSAGDLKGFSGGRGMTIHTSGVAVEFSSWIEVLRTRARERPAARAFTFLGDGEEDHLSYAGLDERARAIAALLQEHGAAGERVLLLYPPGFEYIAAFFGCLYAGAVAVPAYPPRLNRSLPRLRAILEDARPRLALTTAAILARVEGWREQAPWLAGVRWLETGGVDPQRAARWREPEVEESTLAFLQYTSGSTGTPKGVMLSHGNLLHNSRELRRCFGYTAESRAVIWLPPYHDMGLIGGILQPLHGGFPAVLMAPVSFLQQPLRWLAAISRHRATISGGPDFAYDLCVRRIPPAELAGLDLASWEVAFSGAEPV